MVVIDFEFNLILIDVLDFFIIVIESDGIILYVLYIVLLILGYFCDELVGMRLFSYMCEDEVLRVWLYLVVIVLKSDKIGIFFNSSFFLFCMKCGCFYL